MELERADLLGFPTLEESIAMKEAANHLVWTYACRKITLGRMDSLASKIQRLILETYINPTNDKEEPADESSRTK